MAGGFGRTADGHDALDHIGEKAAPLEGLLCAHGPAGDQGDLFDAKNLRYQAVLAGHIVVEAH